MLYLNPEPSSSEKRSLDGVLGDRRYSILLFLLQWERMIGSGDRSVRESGSDCFWGVMFRLFLYISCLDLNYKTNEYIISIKE